MQNVFFVCLGGALGSGLRYWVSLTVPNDPTQGLPYGTLTVNCLGSLVLALVVFASAAHWNPSESTRLFCTVGVLGGFTTYSTFNQEFLGYLDRGSISTAAIYLAVTTIACAFGGGIGMTLGRWVGR